jgi:hypothetical protein
MSLGPLPASPTIMVNCALRTFSRKTEFINVQTVVIIAALSPDTGPIGPTQSGALIAPHLP